MASISSRQHRPPSLTRRQQGEHYEWLARRYLESAGLRFHAANIAVRGGEIDLIMRDNDTWVFVEVRYRRSAHFGNAAESISLTKQQRLRHCAAVWLLTQGGSLEHTPCRFDVLAITGCQLQWLPNAFTADDQLR